jgi:hypothetical protein
MINDYIAQVDNQRHERELVQTIERRRIAAERAAMKFDGDRRAHLARVAGNTRAVAARPVNC